MCLLIRKLFFFNVLVFLLGTGPFCGATGTLCFGVRMTLQMGIKARMDSSSPLLFCYLCLTTLSHVWFEGLGMGPGISTVYLEN